MDLLLLGGTRFFGRFLAESAIARGHRVTLFHRGQTGADLHAGADYRAALVATLTRRAVAQATGTA